MGDQLNRKQKKTWTRQADNRERLIAAGYQLISEKGIEATTVKEVARLADVSPGLFHYYFASKDELLLAVLYKAGARFKEQLTLMLRELNEKDYIAKAIFLARDLAKQNPDWYRLRYELYSLGLRKPDFLPATGTFLATARHEMAQVIMHFTRVEEKQAQAMAAVILACFDGLALQQLAQPELDFTPAYSLIQHLYSQATSE